MIILQYLPGNRFTCVVNVSKTFIIPVLFLLIFQNSLHGQGWQELGTGSNALKANNTIATICTDTDGIVYAGGVFTDSLAYPNGKFYVAKWNGFNWSRLGHSSDSIFANGGVDAMCVDAAHNLYVAGNFHDSNGKRFVAKWDGAVWRKIGAGSTSLNANGPINTMCLDGAGNLYVAGDFTDGVSDTAGHRYVAKWNGTTWSELGTGSNALNASMPIWSIIVGADGYVYAGVFRLGYTGFYFVAVWDGTSWNELGTGSNALFATANITSVCSDIWGNIYVATGFGPGSAGAAKWNGVSWSEVALPYSNGSIISMCADQSGSVYAGGNFTDSIIAYKGHSYVAKWDGANWYEVGTGSNALYGNGPIYSVCVDRDSNIYAGGDFSDSASGYGHRYVAWYHDKPEKVPLPASRVCEVNAYPNPAEEKVIIAICDDYIGLQYNICNYLGNILSSGMLVQNENTVDISTFPPGIYLMYVKGRPGVIKILKQ